LKGQQLGQHPGLIEREALRRESGGATVTDRVSASTARDFGHITPAVEKTGFVAAHRRDESAGRGRDGADPAVADGSRLLATTNPPFAGARWQAAPGRERTARAAAGVCAELMSSVNLCRPGYH
jgi:hypothetical protein